MSIIFDALKKSLDNVPRFVKFFVKIVNDNGIGLVRDTNFSFLLRNKIAYLIGRKSLVGQNFLACKSDLTQKFYRHQAVVNISAAQFKADKLKIFIYESVNFGRFSSTWNSDTLISKNFACSGGVLMNFAKCWINFCEEKFSADFDQRLQDFFKNSQVAPLAKNMIYAVPISKFLRHIPPFCSRIQ